MTIGLKSTPIHGTLRRVVVWFRVLAFAWMGALVTATLLTDEQASTGWVVTALGVALATTLGTILMARTDRLDSWWWVVVDGAATAFIVMAPGLAHSSNLFFGGMGLSWILIVVWAYPSVLHGAVAVATLVAAQLVGSALGVRSIDATDLVGDVAVWIVSGVVYGWALWALRVTDVGRQEAEARLAEERRQRSVVDARAAIAADIHDSVLQSLGMIQSRATNPEVARIAADQDRSLRRYLSRISAEYLDGLEAQLRRAAWDVEDRYGVEVEVVVVRDRPREDAIDDLVAAAREAIVNAARHSGASEISVYAEVGPEAVTVFVKDEGVGFDPAAPARHHGIERSIVDRMRRNGGTARVSSAPGQGTEVELTAPGVDT
jgi:signal transduction histidine kinase